MSTSTSEIFHHTEGDQYKMSIDDSTEDVNNHCVAFDSTRSVGQFTLAVPSHL